MPLTLKINDDSVAHLILRMVDVDDAGLYIYTADGFSVVPFEYASIATGPDGSQQWVRRLEIALGEEGPRDGPARG